MEIITRKEAQVKGLKTYFTGQPCRNNHITYRYAQSGTCAACVKAANGAAASPVDASRREAKAELVQVRIRIYHSDREYVAAAVWALAIMRCPALTQADVDPAFQPRDKDGHTGVYAFNCYQGDIDAVRQLGQDSIKLKRMDTEAGRRTAVGVAAASVKLEPVPDWCRQPRPGDPDYK